jgi:hypothetical protein
MRTAALRYLISKIDGPSHDIDGPNATIEPRISAPKEPNVCSAETDEVLLRFL